jgi:hypothetical protein
VILPPSPLRQATQDAIASARTELETLAIMLDFLGDGGSTGGIPFATPDTARLLAGALRLVLADHAEGRS